MITGKQYKDVYGVTPKKTRECKSCAKRHQLYLERHNNAVVKKDLPTSQSRQTIHREISKINQEIIREKTKTINLSEQKTNYSATGSALASTIGSVTPVKKREFQNREIKKPPSITKMLLDTNNISLTKKPRDRQKFITDQRVIANMTVNKQMSTKESSQQLQQQQERVKYNSVIKKREQIKMNPPQVNIRVKQISGGTVRKKVVPVAFRLQLDHHEHL